MSYERPTHVNAMSKSPSTPRLSTAANVAGEIGTLIVRPVDKLAMSWDAVVQMWFPLTSVIEHEQGIRHGAIPCRRPDGVTLHAPASSPPGKSHSSSDCQTLAHRQSVGLAAKAS